MSRLAIGIDLGGTKIAGGLVDDAGRILARHTVATPAESGPDGILAAVVDLATALGTLEQPICGIGIGSAGVIDTATGSVVAATEALPGWAGTRIAARIVDAFGMPVSVVNDVHAHGIGEAWCGAAAGHARSLVVAAGTGIGAAWVADGHVDPGSRFVAGHLGHIPCEEASGIVCSCGRVGHLEALASGPALHAEYLRRGGDRAVGSARDLAALLHAGDPVACATVESCARALGRGIGGMVNMLDPDIVVVTGGLSSLGAPWWSALRSGANDEFMDVVADCAIVPSTLGGDGAIMGAARLAFDGRQSAVVP